MAVKNKSNKKNKQKHSIKMPVIFSKHLMHVGVAVLTIALVYLLFQIPRGTGGFLSIEKVVFVNKTERINKERLIKKLDLANRSGMLFINLHSLRELVMSNLWVKNVSIRKTWPDTLEFELLENNPVAMINGDFLLQQGIIVKAENEVSEDNRLLRIEINKLSQKTAKEVEVLTGKLMKLKDQFDVKQFAVHRIVLDESESWNIETKTGLLIKVGRKNQSERIRRFLQVFVAIENKNRLKSIDLRYRNGLAVELMPNSDTAEIES